MLMARRLVEAGVDVLTTSLNGPLCGRVQNWDDHAVNSNVFEALKFRSAVYDQAVSALIEDLHERGLDKRMLVVVTGAGTIATDTNGALAPGATAWTLSAKGTWRPVM